MLHRFRPIAPFFHHPTPVARQSRARLAIFHWSLLAAELFMGISAIVGGIGLMINRLGMPQSALDHTPFEQFTIPGIILMTVGGVLVAAGWMVWIRHSFALLASFAAGVVLLGWIVVESVMVRDGRPLQGTVLLFALLIISLSWSQARVQRPPR